MQIKIYAFLLHLLFLKGNQPRDEQKARGFNEIVVYKVGWDVALHVMLGGDF